MSEVYVWDSEAGRVVPRSERDARRAHRRSDKSEPIFSNSVERGRWILDPVTLKLVPAHEYRRADAGGSAYVQRDIDPYKSIVTGEIIGGRRQHREHLKVHDLVEVGTEQLSPSRRKGLPDPRPEIAQAMRERGMIG